MSFGHPIAREMESFWRDHAGRHDDPLWQVYLSSYDELLRLKMTEMGEAHSNEGRFGMSKAGGCTRAATLKLFGHESQLTGSTRATFAIGHQVEVMALATLKALGYPLNRVQGRVSLDPMMSSAIDAETELEAIRTILSVKSAGYKMSGFNFKSKDWKRYGFAQFPLDGVKATNAGYWAQMQAEQHATGIQQSLLIVVAKDMIKKMEGDPILIENGSLTFYAELIPHDEHFCVDLRGVWEKQWEHAQNGEAGPALYLSKHGDYVTLNPRDGAVNKERTGTYDPCDYCDLYDACTITAPLEQSLKVVNA